MGTGDMSGVYLVDYRRISPFWIDKLDRHSRFEVAPCATVALIGDMNAGPVELLVP
jgi:hypothetical protein